MDASTRGGVARGSSGSKRSRPKSLKAKHTGGSTRGDNGAVQASLGDNVDLDGRVATRVVDVAGVDLGNGHLDGVEGFKLLVEKLAVMTDVRCQ